MAADLLVSRCTWEPAESFLDPRSLHDWTRKCDAHSQLGEDLIDAIDAKIEAYHDSKALRKVKRENKRHRLASSSVNVNTASRTATVPRKHKSTEDAETSVPKSRRRSLESTTATTKHTLAEKRNFNKPEVADPRFGPTNAATAAKQPVFYGFGPLKNNGDHVRHTSTQRARKTGSIRNLRHLNNVRKASRRERTPEIANIKLRSMADWAASAPEDTHLQLPPLPSASTSLAEGGRQVSAKSIHSSVGITSASEPAERFRHEKGPSRMPTSAYGEVQWSNSTKKKDGMANNRVDPYEGQEKTLRTLANGRFFYFPGEFLTDLKFGKAHIGNVRIKGLPSWAIGPILKLRTGHLRLEIGSNDVVTTAQWAQLCTGRSNLLQTTGVVIPFEDTAGKVMEMECYLRQHNLAALWYHPSEDIMLVFYSPQSVEWQFLERMGGLPFDTSIRVLTRNKMPPTEMLTVEKITSEETPVSTDKEEPRILLRRTVSFSALDIDDDLIVAPETAVDSSAVKLASHTRVRALPDAIDARPSTDDRALLQTNNNGAQPQQQSQGKYPVRNRATYSNSDRLLGRDALMPRTNVLENQPQAFRLPLKPGQTLPEAFESVFQISYSQLTAVPASKTVDRSPAKARFYLVYPPTAQVELECFQQFLRSRTFHTNICTSLEERGWEAFQNIFKGDYAGVIVVCYPYTTGVQH